MVVSQVVHITIEGDLQEESRMLSKAVTTASFQAFIDVTNY